MAISLKELTKGYNFDSLDSSHKNNLEVLHERINKIRAAYGKPLSVTSGYRSMEDHLRIYKAKGIIDKALIPMGSRHLSGSACDIYDPNQELQKWALANVKLLETIGLWCEHFSATPSWIHWQITPPKSGSRFFKP